MAEVGGHLQVVGVGFCDATDFNHDNMMRWYCSTILLCLGWHGTDRKTSEKWIVAVLYISATQI
jgi:hypothetical protein